MIRRNAHKYRISAMCRVLKISRSVYYYESKKKEKDVNDNIKMSEIWKINLISIDYSLV